MKVIQAAIYARASSEQQAAAHTIESRLAALPSAPGTTAYQFRQSGSLSMTDIADPPSFGRHSIDCVIRPQQVRSTASMSIRPTDSHATMPIRSS